GGVDEPEGGGERLEVGVTRRLGGPADEAVVDAGQDDQVVLHASGGQSLGHLDRLFGGNGLSFPANEQEHRRVFAIDVAHRGGRGDLRRRARGREAAEQSPL